MLTKIKSILKPSYEVTKGLEGNATHGSHGALWEVEAGLECLIEKWKIRLEHDTGTRHSNLCVDLALNKLIEYVGKNGKISGMACCFGFASQT